MQEESRHCRDRKSLSRRDVGSLYVWIEAADAIGDPRHERRDVHRWCGKTPHGIARKLDANRGSERCAGRARIWI